MSLDCPRCEDAKLEEIEIGEIVFDRCVCCAGLWFDNDEIGEFLGKRSQLRDLESSVPPILQQVDAMICPRCSDVALRRQLVTKEEGRDKVIFRCASCAGTWIDRGELRDQEDSNIQDALQKYFKG